VLVLLAVRMLWLLTGRLHVGRCVGGGRGQQLCDCKLYMLQLRCSQQQCSCELRLWCSESAVLLAGRQFWR
jgi:hypothetical protein